jgi:SAM-dependent methyltransferase
VAQDAAEAVDPYDALPYPALSFVQTHPSRMAVAATVLGLTPAPVDHCRVLEIGAAVGANLIPMAEVLPNSEFVGIDLSAREIAIAEVALAASGLKNVRFVRMDLCDLDDSFGLFDYIIVHGVYSWVPAPVRERLMEVCKERLSGNGICYVSYNTYPGWHHLQAIREAMLYRIRNVRRISERVPAALGFIDLMMRVAESGANHAVAFLDWFQVRLKETNEAGGGTAYAFLFHDELAEVNDPVYFHEFVEHAEANGLQYLAEASLSAPPSAASADDIQEITSYAEDFVDAEQYIDHAVNRMFRMSLLCHDDLNVQRPIRPRAGLLTSLGVTSEAKLLDPEPGDAERKVIRYGAGGSAQIAFNHPVSKAAFDYLRAVTPRIVPFPVLFAEARARAAAQGSHEDATIDEAVLTQNLLQAANRGRDFVSLWAYDPPAAVTVSERPLVLPYARYAAAEGDRNLTTLRHERAELPPLAVSLIPFLDGERDHAQLLAILEGFVRDGVLAPHEFADEGAEPPSLQSLLDEVLSALTRYGLLVDPVRR